MVDSPVITSASNPSVKQMRSLTRRKVRQAERAFLVEGRRLVEDAVRNGAQIRTLLVREDIPQGWIDALELTPSVVRRIRTDVFDAASDVEHAQGVAAVCELPHRQMDAEQLVQSGTLILVLDRLRDPGNMGTALRSAAAAGISTVLTTRGSVDPFAPKVVRSGMGAHFRLTIAAWHPAFGESLHAAGRDVVFADASATSRYTSHTWGNTSALVVGGETEPISAELETVVTRRVSIPMRNGVESLNAGVAASILLFEWRRQVGGEP